MDERLNELLASGLAKVQAADEKQKERLRAERQAEKARSENLIALHLEKLRSMIPEALWEYIEITATNVWWDFKDVIRPPGCGEIMVLLDSHENKDGFKIFALDKPFRVGSWDGGQVLYQSNLIATDDIEVALVYASRLYAEMMEWQNQVIAKREKEEEIPTATSTDEDVALEDTLYQEYNPTLVGNTTEEYLGTIARALVGVVAELKRLRWRLDHDDGF